MIKAYLKKLIGLFYCKLLNRRVKLNKPLKGKYGQLRFVASNSIEEFKKLKNYNDDYNTKELRKKKKIRFGFVVYTSSMWNVDELYNLLASDHRFDTSIIIAHFQMADLETSNMEYIKTINYFNDLGYKILKASDVLKNYHFDILFYLTPFDFLDKNVNLVNTSLDTIILHTSYSYMLAGNTQKLDLWMYHWTLRYYTDSEYYKTLIEKTKYYTGNAIYLGFPKMDKYYTANVFSPSEKKIIIYAPHHSVHYSKFKSATFEDNYLAILEIAKKYSEDTYWIYKPHPLLRANSVLGGVFNSVEDYDSYEHQWDSLANAEVITSGDYYSVFKGSSAMITDSVSFLAEYQFTGKPLLLLESGKEKYNQFGDEIVNILYKCGGKAISEIETFVKNVIVDNDEMKKTRIDFFNENLFYMSEGVTANKKIYDDIIRLIEKEMREEPNDQ